MSDNSPTEPAPSQPDQAPASAKTASGVTLQRPAIIGILYLINLFTGFSVIVGVILAYIWRSEPQTEEWETSHFTYQIYTFWLGFAVFMLTFVGYFVGIFTSIAAQSGSHGEPPALLLVVIFGSIFVWLLIAAWFVTRCVLSLVRSSRREPMPRPTTLLF